ncbi:MAG: TetR/AcrR family transcriptional regulator [Pseudonocardiaceae bacterium]
MPVRTAADRGREVRLQLLNAAAELIAELGWNAVSTRNLAERAGVTPGLVHYHFPSLQALLCDAALGMISDSLSATEVIVEDAATVDAGIDLMLSRTGRGSTSLLFIETSLAATRDESLRIELAALIEEFRQKLARWLSEHGARVPEETASVLVAALDGVIVHKALNPELTSSVVAPALHRLVEYD